MKRVLTEKGVAALKPPAVGRVFTRDIAVPGLMVCVTAKGHKSYLLGARFPGQKDYKRCELGQVGAIGLADARAMAREWLAAIKAGSDPRRTQRASADTFAVVAEQFIAMKLPSQRKGWRVERELRREVLPHWGTRPIGSITRRDVRELIQAIVARPSPAYARNVYDGVRAVFSFALNQDIIEHSPVDALKPRDFIGQKKVRERVLDDDEIRALWRACDQLGYPFGPLTRLLLLTGARLNELARASWSEIDLKRRTLVVPAERFKSNSQHIIHLSSDAVAILQELPRWAHGDFLFTCSAGRRPVAGFGDAKERLNRIVGFRDWQAHDLRRVVRSRLAELKVAEHVAELAIGHSRRGLQRIYDRYAYGPEIAEALQAWADRLRIIVSPPPKLRVIRLQR
jgi:integrase